MNSYFILDCPDQKDIADDLYSYYLKITKDKTTDSFWNNLTRQEIKEYFVRPKVKIVSWFKKLNLQARDMSYTIYNEKIQTGIHTDAPPVIAKINFPVLNTQDTYNVWFDKNGKEIDRVECTRPVVLRSNIPHTVEIGPKAVFPRIQFSFTFYNEPVMFLRPDWIQKHNPIMQ